MKYKIGNLKLKNRFLLAPMLEPNDIIFRELCNNSGCALTYTGMISPLSKQNLDLSDKPAIQIFGNSAQGIKSFMKKYNSKVSLWDFNLGCPSKLSRQLKHGAFMHKDIETIENILKIMKNSTKKPITIKLRKSVYAINIAKMAEKYVNAIGIHARTIEQGYSGEPDYEFALNLKKSIKIPVIYSGNVNEKNANKILKDFDFVFIGRESIGNPSIFSKLTKSKTKISFEDYLDLAKKHKLLFRQIKFQAMNFTKGMKSAKKIRGKIIRTKTIKDVKSIFQTNK